MRTFPHGDCCWIEIFGSVGYERVPFMWGEPGQRVFTAALAAQAEAFAAAVRGAPQAGTGADDAIAALTAAELAIRAEHPLHPETRGWWPIGQGIGYGASFVNQVGSGLAPA